MMQVTLQQLMACTGASEPDARRSLHGINSAMSVYGIDQTQHRVGMFLANVAVETMRLAMLREIGSDSYFLKYEGRRDLGNERPGDGAKFKGRGGLQTTGRANYVELRDRLRARGIDCPDFEAEPEKLELPEWAWLSAGDYIDMRKLNAKADIGDFLGYSVGINGRNKKTGLPNHWNDRCNYWERAQKVLAEPPVSPQGDGAFWGNEVRR